jgi:hypothetical protein
MLLFIAATTATVYYIDALGTKSLIFLASLLVSALWRKFVTPGVFIVTSPVLFLNLVIAVTYGVPAVLLAFNLVDFKILILPSDWAYVGPSIDLVALSWLAFSVGWWLLTVIVRRSTSRTGRTTERVSSQEMIRRSMSAPTLGLITRALLIAWIVAPMIIMILLRGAPTYYIENSESSLYQSSFGMVLVLLHSLGYCGAVLCIAMPAKLARRYRLKPLFLAGIGIQLLLIAGGGGKGPIITLFLAIVIGVEVRAAAGGTRRKSLIPVYFAFFFALFVAFRIVSPYRELAPELDIVRTEQTGVFERITAQADLFLRVLSESVSGSTEQGREIGETMTTRLSSLSSLARVLAYVGGQPTYENASSVPLVPVYAVLPRSLFEGKASFIDSGRFAKLNGWIWGGLTVPVPGSLFWIAGDFAAFAGYLFFGIVLAYMWLRGTNGSPSSSIWMMLCILVCFTLWEPCWDALIITEIRYAIVLFGLFAVMRKRYRHHKSAAPAAPLTWTAKGERA